MAIHDPRSERLYVENPLQAGDEITLGPDQSHYLVNVMRARAGSQLLVFNGRDGEWRGELVEAHKKAARLAIGEQVRPQTSGPDIHYVFAPLKRGRLDYMVQKATELGVVTLVPVMTRHTVAERVNTERMRANAIEAAEQCGVLRVPSVVEPVRLDSLLASWPAERTLIFCDEGAAVANPLEALAAIRTDALAVLIGPEGGFAPDERAAILGVQNAVVLSLGPRIMRADTAAVAALALVNAVKGDWQ